MIPTRLHQYIASINPRRGPGDIGVIGKGVLFLSGAALSSAELGGDSCEAARRSWLLSGGLPDDELSWLGLNPKAPH